KVTTFVIDRATMQSEADVTISKEVPLQTFKVPIPVPMPQVPEPPMHIQMLGRNVAVTPVVGPEIQVQKDQMAPPLEDPIAQKAEVDEGAKLQDKNPDHVQMVTDLLKDLEVDQGADAFQGTEKEIADVEDKVDLTPNKELELQKIESTSGDMK
ncbi:hypothetical protein KI387_028894, partial [Taxus chinensis]